MKFTKFTHRYFWSETLQQTIAALTLTAVFALPLSAGAQTMTRPQVAAKAAPSTAKSLTEDQKILHVLNRLGYGARPGDVERVKQTGLDNYIEQQLNADKLDDAVAESKLKNLDVLKMSNDELFAKYPSPAAVIQLVAQNNGMNAKELRGDLKADKKEAKNGQTTPSANVDNQDPMMAAKIGNPTSVNQTAGDKTNLLQQNPTGLSDEQKREYQRQIAEIYRANDLHRPAELTQQINASRILRAVYSERQLQEQMVDFWSNHFNVYVQKASTRWFIPEYDRDVIRPNALGNFRDLLTATAKSPAMLFYLDNFQSVAPNSNQNRGNGRLQQLMQNGQLPERARERIRERTGLSDEQIAQRMKQRQNQPKRGINENYARELMELHTLGVDGGYTQKDVQEIARCFTGWTIVDPRGYRKSAAIMGSDTQNRQIKGLQRLGGIPEDAKSGSFYFNARQHDDGEKTVLGQKIKSGGGMEDGLKVIDILVKQPATAKFIARKLAVKFVNDNPSDALVNRAADAFQKSNGDIKTTLRAVFTSPEFFAPENYRAKIKTPLEVLVSSIRTLGADTNANPALQGLLAKMGEPLYGWIAPTGYPDKAEDWVNTGALLERLNYGLALTSNRIPGTRVDLARFTGRDPDNKEKVMNNFIAVILNNEVSAQTRETLMKQLNQPLPEPTLAAKDVDGEMMENVSMPAGKVAGGRKNGLNAANRLLPPSGNSEVVKIAGLILGSPEFQRQ